MTKNCSAGQITGFGDLCGSHELWGVLGVISGALIFSLCWNILCCVHCTARGKGFLPSFRRSISLKGRDMEDNPIYGNITYTQTREREKEHISQTPSTGRECYANLTLKIPKSASGQSSPAPQIQYSDVVTVSQTQDKTEQQNNGEDNTMERDTCSVVSDLYASVDAKHVKTKQQESNEPYANHI